MNSQLELYVFFENDKPYADRNHKACMTLEKRALLMSGQTSTLEQKYDDGIIFPATDLFSRITKIPNLDTPETKEQAPVRRRGLFSR